MAEITYRVDVYNHDFTTKLTTFVFPKMRNVAIRLNDVTNALFEVQKTLATANSTNLSEMNKVKILRWSNDLNDHVPIWVGSIESIQEGTDTWQIGCVHLLDVLDHRLSSSNQVMTGTARTLLSNLITAMNEDSNTGITYGESDLSDSINFTFNRKTILQIIEDVVKTKLEGEFEIDPDTLELNMNSSIGEDKSASIVFIRDDQNPQATNLIDAKIKTEGKTIVNYLIARGKTSGGAGMTEIVSDSASIAARGRREDTVTFDQAKSSEELADIAQAYLDQHKEPLIDLDIKPELKRYVTNVAGGTSEKGYSFFDDYKVGDLVMVKYRTGYKDVTRTERIVEVQISFDEASNEIIQMKTTNEDQKLIAEIAERTEQEELVRRVQNLETQSYS